MHTGGNLIVARKGRKRKAGPRKPSGDIILASALVPSALSRRTAPAPETAIYVIEAGFLVKIGVSANPAERALDLQVGQGDEVRVFWACRLERREAFSVEAATHRNLTRCGLHVRGEWFKATAKEAVSAVISEIKSRKLAVELDPRFGYGREVAA